MGTDKSAHSFCQWDFLNLLQWVLGANLFAVPRVKMLLSFIRRKINDPLLTAEVFLFITCDNEHFSSFWLIVNSYTA